MTGNPIPRIEDDWITITLNGTTHKVPGYTNEFPPYGDFDGFLGGNKYTTSFNGSANGGNNIALGVRENLDEFAKSVNGSTWKAWGAKEFQSQFLETINNPTSKIHFNLDGVSSPWGAVSEGAMGFGVSRVTSWELFQLYSNPAALERTIFYQGGQIVPNPFR